MVRTKTLTRVLICATVLVIALSMIMSTGMVTTVDGTTISPFIQLFEGDIITDMEKYFDSSVAYKLPDGVKDGDLISVILRFDNELPLLDTYTASKSEMTFTEYAFTDEANAYRQHLSEKKTELLSSIENIDYTLGASYSTVLSGFEIIVKAGDFESLCKSVGKDVTPIVGEVYNPAETKLVENKVDVQDTGIFNTEGFAYDGTGIVVAVLDTGLDYYHTAFSTDNFSADRSKLGLTFSEVASVVSKTKASGLQSGLTASDVYISEKVPYGFDYADKDSDVFPIQSDHGTHVSGIIAGKDDTITGVAPNAQLVEMKIFSDVETTSRTSWIMSALEDCVILGVDVINLSIGTSCGFSRETDKEQVAGVYDKIREAGISLVVAASNSFNSTYGSEKNGNLGLTSNPDSATVGSPSTYKGALCVASINGAKTPYILYGDTIIYFNESTNRVSEENNFFDELLDAGQNTLDIDYVTIPGAGRSADYTGIDVTGKIVLVRRGSSTFEEKANVAQEKGAAGVIIYNNVSGDIKMNVGETTIPVCSIRQDDGELLAAAGTGTIKVSRSQASGPFMSDFSSWGPSPDLEIKPEITAHGGSILSAVPGQEYDRISGTSMATPNVSGLTALLRQYVKENFKEIANDNVKVSATVNRLLMSTADVVYNTNGLPYSVRKQGAGLANLVASAATKAYILTYDRKTGGIMDKSKIELGDDPEKLGKYTLKFSIQNFGDHSISYDFSSYVMTEGVSETKTNDGKTTVNEQGYILDGATVVISSVNNGTLSENTITVGALQTADVTIELTLSDADKQYLDSSFENGMYVEGFIMLDAHGEDIDLGVPYLGFYGDWTEAPIFDIDYYATNKDELDDSIDLLDKTLPDAYASRPIGGISEDYVSYLGSYYFTQSPADVKIAADRKYISLSNQEGAIHALRFVWAGLLRNCQRIEVSIVEDSTGEVVFETVEYDVRKSYGEGGPIYPANVDIEFDAAEQGLKNNTKYTVTLKGFLDYGDGGAETNDSNTFVFPITTDFEAPALTGCEFYTEYDKTAKKNRLFAKLAIYDNHYAMAINPGYIGYSAEEQQNIMYGFDQYMTPIYSEENSTSYVVYELTDYIDEIKEISTRKNTFTVSCYDYALNEATYEIALPDEYLDLYFETEYTDESLGCPQIKLSPNEVYTLAPSVYPVSEWSELLEFKASSDAVRIVNNKLVAVKGGQTAVVVARDPVTMKQAMLSVYIYNEGEEGYKKFDKPVADNFLLTGYKTVKAYYFLDSDSRDIGEDGNERKFISENYSLTMYPSEKVMLRYDLDAYFPDNTTLVFESSNEKLVTVTETTDEYGKKTCYITAQAEGYASVSIKVLLDGKSTYYSKTISIEIKEPYVTSGPALANYYGLGGIVTIPDTLAITEIGQYAFSNFKYVSKAPEDITEEEPEATEITFIGDDTIETVIIPEGVERIGPYAFANLTKLKTVVLPSTLKVIDQGAFYGCVALSEVKGISNVKFINQNAFYGCALSGTLSLDSAVAIADYSFASNTSLKAVVLSESTQSVGAYAFALNSSMESVTIKADKIKLGRGAFYGCKALKEASVNAAVLPAYAFDGCTSLTKVTIGKDVEVIGEFAFRSSAITSFTVDSSNATFAQSSNSPYILSKDGKTLLLVAPATKGELKIDSVTEVADNAFSGVRGITSVVLKNVTKVGNYAFADCRELGEITLGKLTNIGDYAFYDTAITVLPDISAVKTIGAYAFSDTNITSVIIPNGVEIGERAFSECRALTSVKIGDNVKIGNYAFALELYNFGPNRETNYYIEKYRISDGTLRYYYVLASELKSLEIGKSADIGEGAFEGAAVIESIKLGEGAVIGERAFYNNVKLKTVDLSKVVSIGKDAFSGVIFYEYSDMSCSVVALEDGQYMYKFYAPELESVDLSSLESIGEYAFAYCKSLKSLKLGDKLKTVADRAFYGCEVLTEVNLSAVEVIGLEAFAENAIVSVDLSSAKEIGNYAFVYNEELASVKLNENGCSLGEGSFSYCSVLENIDLSKVTYVGDYAFAYTAIVNADLSSAEYIGEHAFIKDTLTDFTVVLSEKLEKMGDNPFAYCRLKEFTSSMTESFNGKDYEKTVNTFDISEKVKVIDGMLYRVVPNGLEFVSYAGECKDITLAENTVRISAMAFAGSAVERVSLPKKLLAIGHKAFYDCEELTLVAFTSYKAPILEEAYDEEYFYDLENNIAGKGEYSFATAEGGEVIFNGIEIVPYFIWNSGSNTFTVYYGANFVDRVGHIEDPIVMVRPVNGQYYDAFVINQYFSTVVEGAAAPDQITERAIALIEALPDVVTLDDKAAVLAAREAYDLITNIVQRSLVTNYNKLTQAENRIKNLEFLDSNDEETTPPPTNDTPTASSSTPWKLIVLCAVGGTVFSAAVAMAVVFTILFFKLKKTVRGDEVKADDECSDEADEEKEETKENEDEKKNDNEE